MTPNQHVPYVLGYTHATMADTTGREIARWSQSYKVSLSSDRGLKFDLLKSESVVIVDHQCHGEYVLEPCTHRPSHQGSREWVKSYIRGISPSSVTRMKS